MTATLRVPNNLGVAFAGKRGGVVIHSLALRISKRFAELLVLESEEFNSRWKWVRIDRASLHKIQLPNHRIKFTSHEQKVLKEYGFEG